jgi:hypothetical protein
MIGNAIDFRAGRRTALSLVLMSPLLAHGQAVDTTGWQCNFCPFEDGQTESEVVAGSLYADDVGARFGEFDGISEDGAYLVVDGIAGARQESGAFWNVTAKDLGVDR